MQQATGIAAPTAEAVKDTAAKEKLVSALKASFDFCSEALGKRDDSRLAKTTQGFGGKQETRAWPCRGLGRPLQRRRD